MQNTLVQQRKPVGRMVKNIGLGLLVSGVVFKKRPGEVLIDLAGYGLGRIFGREYLGVKHLVSKLSEGDEVITKVTGLDDGYGNYEISLQNIQEINKWDRVKDLMKAKKILDLPILDANKGGLITEVEGIKGFVPVSQLTPEHYPRVQNDDRGLILESLKNLVGQSLKLRVISSDAGSNKLILSERSALNEVYYQELKRYIVGQLIQGRVVGLSNFGIFIRFQEEPPLEGLIHISEIPEDKQDFQEKIKLEDTIEAKIIKIEEDRVNLTLKDLAEDPWLVFIRQYQIGQMVQGKLIEKNQDIFGLVEVAGIRGITFENLGELEIGQEYTFRIRDLNPEEKKLILFYETQNVSNAHVEHDEK